MLNQFSKNLLLKLKSKILLFNSFIIYII